MIDSSIKFKKLHIANFGPFYGEHVFDFEHEGGFNRIIGENLDYINEIGEGEAEDESQVTSSNGAAKSFFVKSIGFALFGKVPNGDKINIDLLINKEKGSDLCIKLEFSALDEEDVETYYRIERYRKHKKYKSRVILYKLNEDEWIDVSLAEKKLTQEHIESLLMMNFETFTKTSLLARDGARNFLELKTYERGQVIENIARSDKFFKYTIKIKTALRELRKDIDFERLEHAKVISAIDTLNNQIKKELSAKKNKRDNIFSSIENVENQLKEINEWNLQQDDLNEIDRYVEFLLEKKTKSLEFMAIKKDFESAEERFVTSEVDKERIDKKYKDQEDLISKLEDSDGIICEACGDIANKTEHLNHLENERKKLKDISNKLTESKLKSSKLYDECSVLEKEFDLEKKKLKKFLNRKFNLTEDVKGYVEVEFKKGNKISLMDEIKSHHDEISNLKSQLDNIFDVSNIKEMKKDIFEKKSELYIKDDIIKNLNKRLSMNEWFDSALDFRNENGIKQHIFAKLVPVFNTTLQTYLNIAYEGKMQVTFDTSFNESIIYNDLDYSYYELSTGEKAKLNLVINLAIFALTRINLKSINIMFLDEVFTSMDENAIKKFVQIIDKFYVKKSNLIVYIIEHSHGIEGAIKPKSKIFIKKQNNRSSIHLS